MAKKNYYGSVNPSAAAKALKIADRYFCQITEDGTIYAGSGHVLFKLTRRLRRHCSARRLLRGWKLDD